jgi:hypothetical protein
MRVKVPQTAYTFRTPSLRCQTHELGRPRFIAVWHINDIFPFKLAVRELHKFERREGRTIFRRIWRSSDGEVTEVIWWITPVKRGVDEIGGEGEEDRSTCGTDVNLETVSQATNSGVLEEQCTWICGSGMFL